MHVLGTPMIWSVQYTSSCWKRFQTLNNLLEIGHMLWKTDILMVNIIEMWVFHDIKPSNQFQRSISFLPSCSLENKEILELKMAVLQLNRYGLSLRFRYWKLKWDKRFAGQIIFWLECKRRVSNKSIHRYKKSSVS